MHVVVNVTCFILLVIVQSIRRKTIKKCLCPSCIPVHLNSSSMPLDILSSERCRDVVVLWYWVLCCQSIALDSSTNFHIPLVSESNCNSFHFIILSSRLFCHSLKISSRPASPSVFSPISFEISQWLSWMSRHSSLRKWLLLLLLHPEQLAQEQVNHSPLRLAPNPHRCARKSSKYIRSFLGPNHHPRRPKHTTSGTLNHFWGPSAN